MEKKSRPRSVKIQQRLPFSSAFQKIRLSPSLHNPAKAKEQLIFHSQGFMENYTPPTQ